jgi:regulator of protease activity HflC (stomatin/prohibitin superfamily)
LERAWAWLSAFFLLAWEDHTRELVYALVASGWAVMRLAGKTVQSGQVGVKFSFGRVAKVCEPGFYPLVPIFQVIRLVPSRARTLDLPRQTLTTADGLVFTVDANVVYRVADARKALIEVRDYASALAQVLSLSVHEVLSVRDRASMRVSKSLDRELAQAMQRRAEHWGIEIERAGFTTIRPLRQTLQITQLRGRVQERARALSKFADAGMPGSLALGTLGTHTRLRPRSRALRALERHAREAAELRALTARVDAWSRAEGKDRLAADRSSLLRNAREILTARR